MLWTWVNDEAIDKNSQIWLPVIYMLDASSLSAGLIRTVELRLNGMYMVTGFEGERQTKVRLFGPEDDIPVIRHPAGRKPDDSASSTAYIKSYKRFHAAKFYAYSYVSSVTEIKSRIKRKPPTLLLCSPSAVFPNLVEPLDILSANLLIPVDQSGRLEKVNVRHHSE